MRADIGACIILYMFDSLKYKEQGLNEQRSHKDECAIKIK